MKVSDEWGARGRALDRKERKKIGNKKKKKGSRNSETTDLFMFLYKLHKQLPTTTNSLMHRFNLLLPIS
jgi:hypothetical protein